MAVALMERSLASQSAIYYDDEQECFYRVKYRWKTRDSLFPWLEAFLLILTCVFPFLPALFADAVPIIVKYALEDALLIALFYIVWRINLKGEMAALRYGTPERIDLSQAEIDTLRSLSFASLGTVLDRSDKFFTFTTAGIVFLLIALIYYFCLGNAVVCYILVTFLVFFAEYDIFLWFALRKGIRRKCQKTYMKYYKSKEVSE